MYICFSEENARTKPGGRNEQTAFCGRLALFFFANKDSRLHIPEKSSNTTDMNLKKICLICLGCAALTATRAEEARLLRFPHINGNRIAFSYAGDIYSVDAAGGTARRLTSHNGYEMFPRISPDGKYIAFTGQYDGNTEVFVMPAEGGEPQRLTYTATLERDDLGDRMGPNNIVIG